VSRLFERIRNRQLAVGVNVMARGSEWVEILGHCGLDFVCLDMMITAIGWPELADMVRAAARYDMTPMVRLQSYPWGGDELDARLAADTLRALSVGCEGVLASVNTRRQVEAMVEVSGDWHRRPWIRGQGGSDLAPSSGGGGGSEMEALREQASTMRARSIVGPLIESRGALETIGDILEVPHLGACWLAMGDLTRELGHPGDDRHPELRAAVERVAAISKDNEVLLMVNNLDYDCPERIAEGVTWLWEHGVGAVFIPYPTFAVQWFYETTKHLIDDAVK
jgi:2-keto-3-deoxy-L-rhamnonate aldolase RhmA